MVVITKFRFIPLLTNYKRFLYLQNVSAYFIYYKIAKTLKQYHNTATPLFL